MTTEKAWVVGLPASGGYLSLSRDVMSAIGRSSKAEPGDRLDIARMEALATQLEQAAINDTQAECIPVPLPQAGIDADTLLFGDSPTAWPEQLPQEIRAAAQRCVDSGLLPVLVVDPFLPGGTAAGLFKEPEAPADRWDAGDEKGRRAVEARFRAQIEEALTVRGRRAAISPSGIQNPVVTEILREFTEAAPGAARVDAPVEYRDGSRSAHPFPLRALRLRTNLRAASLELRFALLSIRHTEMDAVVDGAWLRNAEVSRPRPAAQTDDLVFETSVRQLDELCRGERHVRLYMYQTGLETAVVGFYRALVYHLLHHPGTVSVQPMYYEKPSMDSKKAKDSKPVVTESSLFRKGTPWTM
jgi:hypothetical protein